LRHYLDLHGVSFGECIEKEELVNKVREIRENKKAEQKEKGKGTMNRRADVPAYKILCAPWFAKPTTQMCVTDCMKWLLLSGLP
jgi:hypothetical protein